ncbi:MAG: bifunctional riboflavin kinase/FAD synthetase [Hyphomicrobiaceae bacterium]|nr:bifunctional riboflavin kinase/FAD synthetase [Hyphomicrobiaceae bacterium]
MRIVHGYQQVPPEIRGSALAIGNFDGVHRGHQALLLDALAHARAGGRPAGVMVFEPHPREFFRPAEPHFRLTTLEEKLRLIERLGLDFAIVLAFDADLAGLSATRFIDEVLVGALRVAHVVIGYDFFFGKGRGGNPETMQAAGREHDFSVSVVAPVAEAGEVFSSSAIRAKLSAGDVRGAALDLGHWWRVSGIVTGGARRGTGLGFPTANVVLPKGTALAHGIYAVRVLIHGARHGGAAYLGTRPTFDQGAAVLEVFLLDFEGDLYGREIVVELIDFIRGDKRFADAESLVSQMELDCGRAREILREVEARPPLAGSPLAEP